MQYSKDIHCPRSEPTIEDAISSISIWILTAMPMGQCYYAAVRSLSCLVMAVNVNIVESVNLRQRFESEIDYMEPSASDTGGPLQSECLQLPGALDLSLRIFMGDSLQNLMAMANWTSESSKEQSQP